MVIVALAGLVLVLQGDQGMSSRAAASNIEGRPSAAAASPLQTRIDRAEPGATIDVEPGTYQGDLYIDRPVRLVGRGRPRLVASGEGASSASGRTTSRSRASTSTGGWPADSRSTRRACT